MEEEVVARRGWLDHQHFLDLVAAVNFIPGPNSTELAIHIGQLRAGTRGLIVAGTCFITPAMLIILPIAYAYVKWGQLPQALPTLQAIGAAIAAIVLFATWRFSRSTLSDAGAIAIALLVAIAYVLLPRYTSVQPEIPSLMVAAAIGAIRARLPKNVGMRLPIFALPAAFWPDLLRMAGIFLKIGATLFGSGYVLVSYLQSDLVDHRNWLSQRELLDAIAVGQFTPGPLLTTATFVGYVLGHNHFNGGIAGGIIAGIAATAAIFAPSFILVAIFGPLLQRIRRMPSARGALDGMNAAVVGLMIPVAIRLSVAAILKVDGTWWRATLVLTMCVTLAGLFRKLNATWFILGAGAIGGNPTRVSVERPSSAALDAL